MSSAIIYSLGSEARILDSSITYPQWSVQQPQNIGYDGTGIARMITHWNFAGLNQNVNISAATLSIRFAAPPAVSFTLKVYRMIAYSPPYRGTMIFNGNQIAIVPSWACRIWNSSNQYGINAWETVGGSGATDRAATAIGSVSVPNTYIHDTDIIINLDISSIQGILRGIYSNYGLMLTEDPATEGTLQTRVALPTFVDGNPYVSYSLSLNITFDDVDHQIDQAISA